MQQTAPPMPFLKLHRKTKDDTSQRLLLAVCSIFPAASTARECCPCCQQHHEAV